MPDSLNVLLSPVILFFVLGAFAALVRSDLAIPEPLAKGMSIFLMAAIGLKGGVQVSTSGVSTDFMLACLLGIALSFLVPVWVYAALRSFGRLDAVNAGAVAAHYGSVSVVTFATGNEMLTAAGITPPGYMVAVLALMETPAIIAGLMLARRGAGGVATSSRGELLHDTFLNGAVLLLVGSFIIGLIAGKEGFAPIAPVFDGGFRGILCLFLLDMGLIAIRRLRDSRALNPRLIVLAVLVPAMNGVLGLMLAYGIGMGLAASAGLAILTASASYIAVPAAMRLALPQADPGLSSGHVAGRDLSLQYHAGHSLLHHPRQGGFRIMIKTVTRRRIEILVDVPLVKRITSLAEANGIMAYSILPVIGGMGSRGRWADDQLSGAEAKAMFIAISSDEHSEAFVEAVTPLLESHGLILLISPVEVIRGAKF